MRLYKKLFLVLIILVSIVFSIPVISEMHYKATQNEISLKVICFFSSLFSNEEKILNYYPELILNYETKNMEQDEVLFEYLEASFNTKDESVIVQNLMKVFLEFSGYETAVGNTSYLINDYFEQTQNRTFCLECYDCLIGISPNPEYKFYIMQKKGEFLIFQINDTDLIKHFREENSKIIKEYEIWLDNQGKVSVKTEPEKK